MCSLRVPPFCLLSQYFSHVCTSVCSSCRSPPGLLEGRVQPVPACPCCTRAPMKLEAKPSHVTDNTQKDTPAGGGCGCSSRFCTDRRVWTEQRDGRMDGQGGCRLGKASFCMCTTVTQTRCSERRSEIRCLHRTVNLDVWVTGTAQAGLTRHSGI